MDYIADLHIHSPYSRATSKESSLTGLAGWARVKGIQLLGSGDFTHPGWLARLKEELEPAEPGLFRLRDERRIPSPLPGVTPPAKPVRFLLSAEVSSIYKRHGATRKVHNLLYVPDFASAERLNGRLAAIGNIESDGRPILGLDSRDLLEILLESAPGGFLVPAHIWTPWFSLFGSRSGFDAIEECFGDLTPHVFALETGLSSDPEMNRCISALDRFALISNSDCHSPQKLGREANLFATDLDFFALRDALQGNRRDTFHGTVEFFPEEGKYHADGHRACDVCLDPVETRRLGLLCPVCGKPLTVGVQHRVLELADREAPVYGPDAPEVFSLIPLPEVLGEIIGTGSASKGVMAEYARCIARFGSEFGLLLNTPEAEIREAAPLLGEAVARMREGRVIRRPGYDGEFGVIRVFEEGEVAQLAGQTGLFGDGTSRGGGRRKVGAGSKPALARTGHGPVDPPESPPAGPNPEQEAAIRSREGRILVTAGPGTGKTHTLVARLATLLDEGADPERIVCITFTTKAAEELRERLARSVGEKGERLFVGTFHAFCLDWLRRAEPGLAVVGPESRERLLKRLFPGLGGTERKGGAEEIGAYFQRCGADGLGEAGLGATETDVSKPPSAHSVRRYLDELDRLGAIDLDGIIPALVQRLRTDGALRSRVLASVQELFVDEFQDLNAPQYDLVELLTEGARVFAIGDPDQAIYGFRGSDPEFFRRFAARPDVTSLHLARNYRSFPRIVAAATAVIAGNRRADGPTLLPQRHGEGEIERFIAPTPAAEAEFIVRRIEELMGGVEHFSINSGRGGDGLDLRGRSFGDFAILVRLGRQTEEIAAALSRRGIPCQQVGAVPYYMGPALRGACHFLQLAAGSPDLEEWLALLRDLPGIGAATLERLEAKLPLSGDFLAAAAGVSLPPAAVRSIGELAALLERFRTEAPRDGIAPALAAALPFLGSEPADGELRRFLDLAGSFGADHGAFARHLRRQAAATATVYDERAEAVPLMTLHAAKGLEFQVVFLAGLEEGLLPCTLMGECDLEEERRLFYVGMTRARERLLLTGAAIRPWAGPGKRQPSRFLAEIPERLVVRADAGPVKKSRKCPDGAQLELFDEA
jgi:ATP-dependent DNA helicase UvrD/PcrA